MLQSHKDWINTGCQDFFYRYKSHYPKIIWTPLLFMQSCCMHICQIVICRSIAVLQPYLKYRFLVVCYHRLQWANDWPANLEPMSCQIQGWYRVNEIQVCLTSYQLCNTGLSAHIILQAALSKVLLLFKCLKCCSATTLICHSSKAHIFNC